MYGNLQDGHAAQSEPTEGQGRRTMKRLQCESCGSTEIRKVGDSIYECLSCGVRYDLNDVQRLQIEHSGTVKIDHSDEVKNHIIRAEQYEADGDISRALYHYNAALDLDATNETAKEAVKRLSKNIKYRDLFVVDAKLSSEEIAETLLREMATTENIACDIYKEIDIRKAVNKYAVFAFIKGKYQISWSAIMCYREYENQIVYVDRYDPKYGLRKVPTTERVEKIRRMPSSGERVYDTDRLVLASDLFDVCEQLYSEADIDALYSDFAKSQDIKYGDYKKEALDLKKLTEKDGKLYYNDIEISLEYDNNIVQKCRRDLSNDVTHRCAHDVDVSVAGGYSENFNSTCQTLNQSTVYICIPIQVVEYTYRSQNFLAICDMVSHTTTISKTYPEDIALFKAKSGLKREEKTSKGMPGAMIAGIVIMVLLLVWLVFMAITNSQILTEIGGIVGLCGAALLSFALLIVGGVQKSKRANSFQNKMGDMHNSIYIPRRKCLTNGYKEFFGAYSGLSSLDTARSSVSVSGIVDKDEIMVQISLSDEIKKFDENYDTVVSEDEQKISDLEAEIKKLKVKRNRGIVLMCVSCFVIYPLFVAGLIILGNANRDIINKNTELNRLMGDWIH